MNLEQKVMSQMKVAMKEKNTIALESLRAIKSEILLLKTSGNNQEILENQEIEVLQKMVKQRKEAAEQFQQSQRNDAAQKELQQAEVIQSFLPKQLSQDELKEKIEEIISQTGASSVKEMGKVMGIATKSLAGKADGKSISQMVKSLLS